MPKDNQFLIERTWKEIRTAVMQINPELATIIDNIDPPDDYKLIEAHYFFGDLIVNHGTVQLPDQEGHLVPIHAVKQNIAEGLLYCPIPVFLILEKSCEVFVETGARVVPLNIYGAGNMLGLFEGLDYLFDFQSTPIWSVSSGARSIIMLPKITETTGLRRLRSEFKLSASLDLNQLADHAPIFFGISRHPNFGQEWKSKVLFFTKEWLKHKDDANWMKLHHYFYKSGWKQANFEISRGEINLGWEVFVDALAARKTKPYVVDHLKHVLSIAYGRFPGFRPNDDSQLFAPTHGLQKAFIDIYQLKQYSPTFLYAHQASRGNTLPIYYSLSYSTLVEGSPKNLNSSTIMVDFREMKLLIDTAIKRASKSSSRFHTVLQNTSFEYFHVEDDKYGDIQSSKNIPEKDTAFRTQKQDHFQDRSFCSTSTFWRGCIRIWPNSNVT